MSAPNTAATLTPLSPKESLTPFLMSPQPAVDMVALASAADAPFDSEAPFADLGTEAIVTIESASPRSNTGSPLLQATTRACSPPQPAAADLDSFFALDANFLALATSSSSSSSTQSAGTVSPMALKLESPLLTPLAPPSPSRPVATTRGSAARAAKRARASTVTTTDASSTSSCTAASSSSSTGPRKRSQDPADKEARARERVLRNRAAAQESRDKKRKYVAEMEASNAQLQEENCQLLKRLKTVEEDNQSLAKRLEALTAQFEKMQQQLTMSGIQHTTTTTTPSGVGFCQSAVLAKKDGMQVSTNSPQQKLAPPPKRNLPRTSFLTKTPSMTVASATTTKRRSWRTTAPYPVQSARCQSSEEICSRSFRLNSDKILTLSSSTPACLRRSGTTTATRPTVIQLWLLRQVMLTSLTLFWISTGARSNSNNSSSNNNSSLASSQPPRQPWWSSPPRPSFKRGEEDEKLAGAAAVSPSSSTAVPMSLPHFPTIRVSKDVINSLSFASVQEILTEYRQGRQEAARRLLLKVLLSSTTRLQG